MCTTTDAQSNSGYLINANRRAPAHCLYCEIPATSLEHIVPEAIGGRLTANILCPRHNAMVNAADEPLSKNFAPLVTMLQVPRQRGRAGAEFRAQDADGKPIVILREGFAKEKPLDVQARDDHKRIARAAGDLALLDALPAEAFSDASPKLVLAVITNPEAHFVVASDEHIVGGILKMALHFFAGFVSDISIEDSSRVLPYILGEKTASGEYVRTPLITEDAFPDSWPPRHEITCYPMADCTLITVLLFGAYAYTCRLPFVHEGTLGWRYQQVLSENFPGFFDDVPRPKSLDWNARPGPGDAEAWSGPIQKRLERIHHEGAQQAIRAKCRRAYEHAVNESSNIGNLWERYRAALQLEVLSTEEVDIIIKIGQQLAGEEKPPWEIPVVLSAGGESE